MTRPATWIKTLAATLWLVSMGGGCGSLPFTPPASLLTAQSQTHKAAELSSRFDHAIYSFGNRDTLTIVLIAGPLQQPTQAATIRMFWRPRAGATPVTATATNASVHYILFPPSGQAEIGVYSGAGFLFPTSRPGSPTLRGELWQAHLRLSDRSEAFDDRLGQAVLRGDITARRDDAGVTDLLHQLNTMVTERLGYARLVSAKP